MGKCPNGGKDEVRRQNEEGGPIVKIPCPSSKFRGTSNVECRKSNAEGIGGSAVFAYPALAINRLNYDSGSGVIGRRSINE